ncbi:peptidoglycan D,D-transpeptidase FtsI family protein [Niallia sp. Krafla_26]|uniref:peptidoglycan D,D-transpeptidase FtsI family protein n=1 Tax=Niallia sp. Krafla_26 TaxID=3064703 RepID=UPI003D180B2B
MLFFIVFLLFSVLILRLGVVQIVYGEDYKREIERTEDVTVNKPVPRGKMYDTNGNIVVDNYPERAITYTNNGVSQEEMIDVATKLAKLIEKDTKKVTERDKKDFWILNNKEKAEKKVSEKERNELSKKYEDKEEFNSQVYKLTLDRITEEDLNSLSDEELEVLAIYREFTSGYKFTPQIVKNKGVTAKEFAIVSENLQHLPGVDTTTDWGRSYAYGDTLRSILGEVSSSDKGLPAEEIDYYLSRGYSRNDRVGVSYLEKQYEDVLQGQKAKKKNITDQSGEVVSSEVIAEGQRGRDLVLTIDMDLQRAVEAIIEDELRSAKAMGGTRLLDRAYVVLMDPNTGEIKSLAGKRIVRDEKTGKTEMQDDALGTFTTTYTVGSVVKGATILTGFQTGAISPGTVIYDTPIRIKGSNPFRSWKPLGPVNDVTALKYSSNIYMAQTFFRIANANYVPNRSLKYDPNAFGTIRQHFAQFGLGVRTGIDLPNEQNGYKGGPTLAGLMFLGIGQYDTYSTLQLAQYVSTIANGGYRMEPHMVKEIREPQLDNELGPVVQEIQPKVLNRLDLKDGWIERVQLGFKKVTQETGGTGASYFKGKPYSPAGKTGTAEAFYDGPLRQYRMDEVTTLSFVGYAPAENPEIAMAVLVPWAYQGGNNPKSNMKISERVMDTYFELKKQRAMNETIEQNSTNEQSNGDQATGEEVQEENSPQE